MHRFRIRKASGGVFALLLLLLMGVGPVLADVSVVLLYETRNIGEIEQCG